MKLTIARKLLILMLLTTALVIVLIAGITRFSISSGFTKYMAESNLHQVDSVVAAFTKEYARRGNWDLLRKDPIYGWLLIVHAEVAQQQNHPHDDYRSEPGLPGSSHDGGLPNIPPAVLHASVEQLLDDTWTAEYAAGRVPPPIRSLPPSQPNVLPPGSGGQPPPDAAAEESAAALPHPQSNFLPPGSAGQPHPDGAAEESAAALPHRPPNRPPPPDIEFQSREQQWGSFLTRFRIQPHRMNLYQRIGLFDNEYHLIWGNADAMRSELSEPIKYQGKTVAQFKLVPEERLSNELRREFVDEQSWHLLYVSIIAFVLSAVSAVVLSKHFVGAIDAMVTGARRLTGGDFTTRLKVTRSDELGQLANDFNKLATALEEHDRVHKQWVADTSHELRTPLTILRAQVEAFQDKLRQPDVRSLAVLHAEIMALSKLVDDLQELAKWDVGELHYNLVPVDVASVLQDAIDAFAESFAVKPITLAVSPMPDGVWIANADPSRLKQLFRNILKNSLRYTNENGRVEITGHATRKELILTFSDSEPGLAPNVLPRIFERFYRAEASRSRSLGGTGLGLAICKSIAESHGGQISGKHSSLGGLQLDIRLPLLDSMSME